MSTPTKTADTTATAAPAPPAQPKRSRVEGTYFVMLLPVLILFSLFITAPALLGVFYSFTNYVGYGSFKFVGFTNYASLFTDANLMHSYGFTLLFAIVTTILTNVIALGLALGLNAKIRAKTALRGIFFIPMVISGIVIAYVFNYLFSTSIPTIAKSLGITGLENSILANSSWAWLAIVIVSAWQACPGAIIIYLAGLLAIPPDVYEAAAIDGAGHSRAFRSITFPLIFGYVVINTILGFKAFLNVYEIIVGLTNGGPGTSTISVAMSIFTGFTGGDYSYQMANAVVFFLVTLILSLLQLQLIRRRGVSL